MTTHPRPVAEVLAGLAEWFLADGRDGGARRVMLDIGADGTPCLANDGSAFEWEGMAPPELVGHLESWSLVTGGDELRSHPDGAGPSVPRLPAGFERGLRLVFRVDPTRVEGELQAPDVLLALRELAVRWPDLRFSVRLPSDTRDVWRARASLDSRPAGDRKESGPPGRGVPGGR